MPPPPFLSLPTVEQRAFIARRLAGPPPAGATGLSDGHRLPGREGALRPAAVLLLLVDRPTGLYVLLTERSADLADHPGQISFPGGRLESTDVDAVDAALREAFEETGLPRERVGHSGRAAALLDRFRVRHHPGGRLDRAAAHPRAGSLRGR